MPINQPCRDVGALPGIVPIFPLLGALLLPRGEMPLNIFEPRYLQMVDDALKGARVIGMVQPDPDNGKGRQPNLCAVGCLGRITSLAESGDGRYLLTLTGVARFRIVAEETGVTAYRRARVDYKDYAADIVARAGEDEVDRTGLLRTLADFLEVNDLKADWGSIERAPVEALVNALAMMSPFGPREKQAFLEAADLKARADMLVAVAEMELARSGDDSASIQ